MASLAQFKAKNTNMDALDGLQLLRPDGTVSFSDANLNC